MARAGDLILRVPGGERKPADRTDPMTHGATGRHLEIEGLPISASPQLPLGHAFC